MCQSDTTNTACKHQYSDHMRQWQGTYSTLERHLKTKSLNSYHHFPIVMKILVFCVGENTGSGSGTGHRDLVRVPSSESGPGGNLISQQFTDNGQSLDSLATTNGQFSWSVESFYFKDY